MSNTSDQTTQQSKTRLIVGEIGVDTETGIIGKGHSYDNGKTFVVDDTIYGRIYHAEDHGRIWQGIQDQVAKVVEPAKSAANSAVAYANNAIKNSLVNSQAIAAQSEAISEAKSAMDSATAEIQQTAANAASDSAKIRADVAQVQSEVDTAKAANSASVEALKSDVSAAKQDLADVHDSLTKAQAAAEESQKTIDNSIAQINSDIEQDRKDIASAQQANADTAKQLDTYSKQAQDQGKTIKSIQDKQDDFTATLADVQGNVTQVSGKVDGLSTSLKDAQDNVASVKAQADQLSATLTDHTKSIATLTASAEELSSTLEDADGRLSKVEQTAQTNSSTLSDVQGDLSQVKQDATTLTSTLKDAQGNISTLQQKADSVSAQLASAQGDIVSLQTDVKGIKATLVSHEGDIHTLQADSKSLHDSMQDVQGNISTLQKTSTDVTSELQDHAGRISKVEQTASTLTNEFSDQDGRLSKVEQTATGTQQTVANQQGQINSIQTDVSGIHETLTGQGNQIATINTTLNGLNTKYEGVSGDLGKLKSQAQWVTVTSAVDLNNVKTPCHEFLKRTVTNAPNEVAWWYLTVESSDDGNRVTQTVIADQSNNRYTRRWADSWSAWVRDATQTDVTNLSNRITTNSTQITQNKQAIALKADQTTVDKTNGTVQQLQSQLKIQADQIASKVSSSDLDAKGYATTSTVQSLVTQEAGALNESITNLEGKFSFSSSVNLAEKTNQGTTNWSISPGNGASTISEVNIDGVRGVRFTQTKKSTSWWVIAYQLNLDYFEPNQDYIISFDIRTSSDNFNQGGMLNIARGDSSNAYLANTSFKTNFKQNQLTHVSCTGHSHSSLDKNGETFYLDCPGLGQCDWVDVVNLKIARGTIDKGYSPAPSDNATVTQIQQVTASVDGLQSTVANKADASQVTQLSNLVQSKVSTSDFTSKVSQLSNDINARVTKGDLISQINLEAGNTLIQSGKIYLDANTIVFGKNSKAIIPSAAIGEIDASKITTGSIGVPMSDAKGKATVKVEDGKVIITGIGPGVDQVHSSLTPFDPDYIGQSDITIDHEGLSFDATIDIWNGHPGTNKALGVFRPTSLDTADTAGVSYIVKNFPSNDGPQNAGDYFAIDRQGLGEYQYIHGIVYKASEDHGSVHLGTHFYDPVYIHPYGAETGIRSTWCSWSSMGNRKFPVLVNSDHGWSGIAFPMEGSAFIFDNNGYVARPNQKIDNYNDYGEGNKGWYDPTDSNQAGQTIDYSKWA